MQQQPIPAAQAMQTVAQAGLRLTFQHPTLGEMPVARIVEHFIVEHLEELRKRLLWIVASLLACFLVGACQPAASTPPVAKGSRGSSAGTAASGAASKQNTFLSVFVDLDGMNDDQPRRRRSTVIGFNDDEKVGSLEFEVPVSGHAIDSISLRDARLGMYEQLQEMVGMMRMYRPGPTIPSRWTGGSASP